MDEAKNVSEAPQSQSTQNTQSTSQSTVGFGDKTVELSLFDRYKGKAGQTDRIAVISKSLLRGTSHFFNQRTFRCLTTDELKPELCCEKTGVPMQKFALVVFHYNADPKGEIVDESKCQGTLKIWVLTESRYKELSEIHKQWPLLNSGFDQPQSDLVIECQEEQFQRMKFIPSPVSHWKRKETWYQTLERRAEKAKDSLAKSLGKRLTVAEIKEILGVAAPATPPTKGPADIDLNDVLDPSTPAAPAQASTAGTELL